jgi:hypothetical protein
MWSREAHKMSINVYQNALGGRFGHPGDGKGGANCFVPSSYKWFSSDTDMTCCLLNTYSDVGFLAGLFFLDLLELLLSVSQSIVGRQPTSFRIFGVARGSAVDVEVPGRVCGRATGRLKTFGGGRGLKTVFAMLGGKCVAEFVWRWRFEERSRP